MDINFKVTPSHKKTIDLRAAENGFDDIAAYLKVIALKTQNFAITTVDKVTEEATQELGFTVTDDQNAKIIENMKESACEDLTTYLRHLALHTVVTTIVEVRSTGDFDDMLKRITEGRRPKNLKKLF